MEEEQVEWESLGLINDDDDQETRDGAREFARELQREAPVAFVLVLAGSAVSALIRSPLRVVYAAVKQLGAKLSTTVAGVATRGEIPYPARQDAIGAKANLSRSSLP